MNLLDIQILEEAEEDLNSGVCFYERQSIGVGEYFWDSLLSDIESLMIYAGVHSEKYGYYRMSAKRFPYSIYYSVENKVAYVVAVLPMRRDPKWIQSQLSQR